MSEGVVYRSKHFTVVTGVTWEDAARKFRHDEAAGTVEIATPDLIKCEDSSFLPGTLKPAWDEILHTSGLDIDNVYMFMSYKSDAETYNRHKDEENVFLVQAFGKMMYRFDDGSVCVLEPGDSLYIPGGVYHDPKTLGRRVTISCKVL